MNADPRQVAATALQFDTRKTAAQNQLGGAFAQQFSGWTLNAAFYGGHRDVRQYLAIPLATQAAPTHSGGVVDLDRDYGGASLRLTRETRLLGQPFTLTLGGEYERMVERRKGFINNNGGIAGLKRDHEDPVSAAGAHAPGEWPPGGRLVRMGGAAAQP